MGKAKVIKKTNPSSIKKADSTVMDQKKEEPKKGVYKVENILLLESLFTRLATDILIKEQRVDNEISIQHEPHETKDSKFGVTFTLSYTGKQNDTVVCKSTIKMLGVFEISGEPPVSEEIFKKINAPAIIYPFIREHLHNICIKSGIANIFLPTVNFRPW